MQSTSISARPRLRRVAVLATLAIAVTAVPFVRAQSLMGSRESLLRQNAEARDHDFTYLRTSSDVRSFARKGLLVRLRGNSDYRLASDYVSFPYARPEVKLFIERLADQYRAACGERLYVTSLTRPITRQPSNASHLSVHPTGMAVDLRRSYRESCRQWLEETLLHLEGQNVLEATREKHPPHYHVTLFPKPYLRYIGVDDVPRTQIAKSTAKSSSRSKTSVASSRGKKYRVGRGDTLWNIARKHGVSVTTIKRANGIRSSRLKPGQVLAIPTR
jgi:LysM repeat protein